jgi:ADP-heptose:LPS heptosyltransferase
LGVSADGPPRVTVNVTDRDRLEVARQLHVTWSPPPRVVSTQVGVRVGASRPNSPRTKAQIPAAPIWDEPDGLHAGRFGASAPLLAVHLGAGTAAKRWPLGYWQSLVARFLTDGWRVALVGGAEDVAAAGWIEPHANLGNWTGRLSVAETTALLERADLFLGADSGPSHLAASAGVPSVVLFSGTNRVSQWRPWSRRSLVLRSSVPCRPCHLKVCPLAGHPCMSNLTPERVHRAAQRWWSRMHRRESPHAPL